MIHNLSVQKDARRVFQIESFGFRERGFMNLTVSSFSVRVALRYRSCSVFVKGAEVLLSRELLWVHGMYTWSIFLICLLEPFHLFLM